MRKTKRVLALVLAMVLIFGNMGSALASAAGTEPSAVESSTGKSVETSAENPEAGPEISGHRSDSQNDDNSNEPEIEEPADEGKTEDPSAPGTEEKLPADENKTEEPAEDEPTAEPTEDEPAADEPSADEPADEPAADEPTEEPADEPPAAAEKLTLTVTPQKEMFENKQGETPNVNWPAHITVNIMDQNGSDTYNGPSGPEKYNVIYAKGSKTITYTTIDGKEISKNEVINSAPGSVFHVHIVYSLDRTKYPLDTCSDLPDSVDVTVNYRVLENKTNHSFNVKFTLTYDGNEHTFAGVFSKTDVKTGIEYVPNEGTEQNFTPDVPNAGGTAKRDHTYIVNIDPIKVKDVGTKTWTVPAENLQVLDKKKDDITNLYNLTVNVIVEVKQIDPKEYTMSMMLPAHEWVYGEMTRSAFEEQIKTSLEGPMKDKYGEPTFTYNTPQGTPGLFDKAKEHLDVGTYEVAAVWKSEDQNMPELVYNGIKAQGTNLINVKQRWVMFRGVGSSSEGQESYWKFYDGTPFELPAVEQVPAGYHPDGGQDVYFYDMVKDDTFSETLQDQFGNKTTTNAFYNAGWGTNYFNVKLNGDARDLSPERMEKNYHITLDMGPVGVFPRLVMLYSCSFTKEYDGTALDNSYDNADGGNFALSGDTTLKTGIFYYNGKENTYEFENPYNGQGEFHRVNDQTKSVEYTAYGFVPGEGITNIQMTGSQTDVGTGSNTFTYTLNENTNPGNYMIFATPGTLTVTQPDASAFNPTISQENWIYGEEKAPEVSITSQLKDAEGDDLAELYGEPKIEYGYNCTHLYENEWTDDPMWSETRLIDASSWDAYEQFSPVAGGYSVRATWHDDSGNLPDVTVSTNYNVYPRPIHIKTFGLAKIYDGEPAEDRRCVLVGGEYKGVYYYDSLVYNDFLWFDPNSFHSQTDVTMDPDGNPLVDAGYLNSCHWSIMTPAHDEYGDYDATIVDSSIAGAVQTNYLILEDIGTIGVYRRPVVFTSADLSKVYDGAALNNFGYNDMSVAELIEAGAISTEYDYNEFNDPHATEANKGQGGLIPADAAKVTIDFTGTRTLPGTSPEGNTFEVNWNDVNTNNYYFDTRFGDLEITDAANVLTVQPNGLEVPYNGGEHTVEGFESLEFELNGHTYTVEGLTAGAVGTNAGTYPVAVNGEAVVRDEDGNDVTSSFTVRILDAELVVNPIPVTVTANNATKAAGAADPAFTAVVTGLVAGDDPGVINYGLTRAPGEAAGQYAITPAGAVEQGNYIVTYVPGVLTITPAPVVPPADDDDDDDDEPVVIEEDEPPLGGDPGEGPVEIQEDATPLANGPVGQACCILHLLIMLVALVIGIYYTHDKKKRLEDEFEVRAQLV